MQTTNWTGLAFESWNLGIEAAEVVAMRVALLGTWDARARAEAALMISEKVSASLSWHWQAMSGGLGSTPCSVARNTVAHYRKTVRANRRRLRNRHL